MAGILQGHGRPRAGRSISRNPAHHPSENFGGASCSLEPGGQSMRTFLKSAALTGLMAVAGCGGVPDADPPVVHVEGVVGLAPASEDPTRQSGVQSWEVWRSASGLTVIAIDQSGARTPALQVVHGRAGALTI